MSVAIHPSTHRPVQIDSLPPVEDKHLDTLAAMAAALEALQADIVEDDLPPRELAPCGEHYLGHLKRLNIVKKPTSGFYDINLLTGDVGFGTPMLEALSQLEGEKLARLTEVFLLHETLHIDQKMYSSTHHGIGHASVVLEEMDYFADAVSMSIGIARRIRLQPDAEPESAIRDYARMAVEGLQLFDRTDAPDGLVAIGEARLRRYLIWLTQYVRLTAARDMSQVHASLFPRVTVELEPLAARLTEYGDREFPSGAGNEHTQFFACVGGNLVRQASIDGFSPADLYTSILTYDFDAATECIRYVVMENRETLLPML